MAQTIKSIQQKSLKCFRDLSKLTKADHGRPQKLKKQKQESLINFIEQEAFYMKKKKEIEEFKRKNGISCQKESQSSSQKDQSPVSCQSLAGANKEDDTLVDKFYKKQVENNEKLFGERNKQKIAYCKFKIGVLKQNEKSRESREASLVSFHPSFCSCGRCQDRDIEGKESEKLRILTNLTYNQIQTQKDLKDSEPQNKHSEPRNEHLEGESQNSNHEQTPQKMGEEPKESPNLEASSHKMRIEQKLKRVIGDRETQETRKSPKSKKNMKRNQPALDLDLDEYGRSSIQCPKAEKQSRRTSVNPTSIHDRMLNTLDPSERSMVSQGLNDQNNTKKLQEKALEVQNQSNGLRKKAEKTQSKQVHHKTDQEEGSLSPNEKQPPRASSQTVLSTDFTEHPRVKNPLGLRIQTGFPKTTKSIGNFQGAESRKREKSQQPGSSFSIESHAPKPFKIKLAQERPKIKVESFSAMSPTDSRSHHERINSAMPEDLAQKEIPAKIPFKTNGTFSMTSLSPSIINPRTLDLDSNEYQIFSDAVTIKIRKEIEEQMEHNNPELLRKHGKNIQMFLEHLLNSEDVVDRLASLENFSFSAADRSESGFMGVILSWLRPKNLPKGSMHTSDLCSRTFNNSVVTQTKMVRYKKLIEKITRMKQRLQMLKKKEGNANFKQIDDMMGSKQSKILTAKEEKELLFELHSKEEKLKREIEQEKRLGIKLSSTVSELKNKGKQSDGINEKNEEIFTLQRGKSRILGSQKSSKGSLGIQQGFSLQPGSVKRPPSSFNPGNIQRASGFSHLLEKSLNSRGSAPDCLRIIPQSQKEQTSDEATINRSNFFQRDFRNSGNSLQVPQGDFPSYGLQNGESESIENLEPFLKVPSKDSKTKKISKEAEEKYLSRLQVLELEQSLGKIVKETLNEDLENRLRFSYMQQYKKEGGLTVKPGGTVKQKIKMEKKRLDKFEKMLEVFLKNA